MQIEVVDDHSTRDDPAALVRELAGERVAFFRQARNLGHVGNFNTCLQRARGHLIHLLHGDDLVFDGFYRTLGGALSKHPHVGAAFCRHAFINAAGETLAISEPLRDESGILENWLERLIVRQYIQTPSIVVRREIYERLGGFDPCFKYYYEDWEMWVRLATRYPTWFETSVLAAYRIHAVANSGRSIRTGENIQDLRRGLALAESYLCDYLPPARVHDLLNQNREYSALCALQTAENLLVAGERRAAFAQIREALICSRNWPVLKRVYEMARSRFDKRTS